MSNLNNNAFLKDENILTLLSLNNLIVPEIQREYVWGNNPDVLKKFLQDIKRSANICGNCGFAHGDRNNNIGFLYSYKPPYVELESGRFLDEFLIDGQQRITTLFLLLLSRAVKEQCMDEFLAICRAEGNGHTTCFSYKVRNLTQAFLDRLVLHIQEDGTEHALDFISSMNYPSWLLSDFKNDPSVESMLKALQVILEIFDDTSSHYFDYILRSIHFWHFKTEATSQGEDLYITMNSRGEQLTRNEMKKADLLPQEHLMEWGPKWESWQTLFWKRRGANENADKGFNSFLACIEGLESFINEKDSINIDVLEKYINALEYVSSTDFRELVKSRYPNCCSWFDSFLSEVWAIINLNRKQDKDIDWKIVRPRDAESKKKFNNQALAKNKAMILWPWLYYYVSASDKNQFLDGLLIRIIHFYYIRYNCYKRSVTTIKRIVDSLIAAGRDSIVFNENSSDENVDDNRNNTIFSDEELFVSSFCDAAGDQIIETETAIWNLQHRPELLDGRDVGGDTFYGFVSDGILNQNCISTSDFDSISSQLSSFFDNEGGSERFTLIKRILLYYEEDGVFWHKKTPNYYFNYETSAINRIVRTKPFLHFYKDFINDSSSKSVDEHLKDFLTEKQNQFLRKEENRTISYSTSSFSHSRILALYDIVIDNIWSGTDNLALWPDSKSTGKLYATQPTLWCANIYYDSKREIKLPENWADILNKRCEAIGLKLNLCDFSQDVIEGNDVLPERNLDAQ